MGDEAATATFVGKVGSNTAITNFNVTAGNAATEDATATVQDDLTTTAITLTDSAATADATIIFDAATAGDTITVAGTIDGGNAGDGILEVGDGTSATIATFTGVIGATDIEALNVRANSTANISQDVDATTTAATDVGLDVDANATLNIDSSTVGVDVTVVTGDIDIDGTVGITGSNATTLTAASDIFIDGASTFTTALTGGVATTLTATAGDITVGDTSDTTIVGANQIAVVAGGDLILSGATGKTVTIQAKKVSGGYAPTTEANALIAADGLTGDVLVDEDGTVNFGINADSAAFDDGDSIWFVDGDSNVEQQSDGADTTIQRCWLLVMLTS